MHAQTDTDAAREFADIVGASQLLTGERIGPDYHHDEALVGEPVAPRFVARPQTAEQVAALLAAATRAQMPVTARLGNRPIGGCATLPERPAHLVRADERRR